jgi:hypothetical protein
VCAERSRHLVGREPVRVCQIAGHTTAPNILPTSAVISIASAPQKVTLNAPRKMLAPPACAAHIPSAARKTSDRVETARITLARGTSTAVTSGNAAPTENVAADASAA